MRTVPRRVCTTIDLSLLDSSGVSIDLIAPQVSDYSLVLPESNLMLPMYSNSMADEILKTFKTMTFWCVGANLS